MFIDEECNDQPSPRANRKEKCRELGLERFSRPFWV